MAKFLLKLALWAMVLILTAGMLEAVQTRSSSKSHPPNLILGDSHAGPVKLKTFANLSHAGDPLFVQLLKAFRHGDLTGKPPQFVTLTVGPQNFSALSELRIDQDHENWRSSRAARLAALADVEDYLRWVPAPVWIEAFMKEFTLPEYERLYAQNFYKKTYRNNANERIQRQMVGEPDWLLEDSHAWHALSQLVDLTTSWGAQLLILETPRHEHYESQVFTPDLTAYRQRLSELAGRHAHVTFVPSDRFAPDTEWFGDSDHLNSFGAECLNQDMIEQDMLPAAWTPFLKTAKP